MNILSNEGELWLQKCDLNRKMILVCACKFQWQMRHLVYKKKNRAFIHHAVRLSYVYGKTVTFERLNIPHFWMTVFSPSSYILLESLSFSGSLSDLSL